MGVMAKEALVDPADQVVVVATATIDAVVVGVGVVEAVEGSTVASSMGLEEAITEEVLRMFVMEDSRGTAATTI